MLRICLALMVCLPLAACQSVMLRGATEVGHAVAESRSVGQVIDDATIYTAINHHFLQTDVNDLLPNVNVVVRQGRVLLTGVVNNPDTPRRAVKIAWRVSGVKEVINEIEVDPEGDIVLAAQDEWIEKQVEARLAITKGVNILNYSVEVENGKVYLLGVVASAGERDNALAVARRVRGVREVISHLRLAEPHELTVPDPTDRYPDTEYRR